MAPGQVVEEAREPLFGEGVEASRDGGQDGQDGCGGVDVAHAMITWGLSLLTVIGTTPRYAGAGDCAGLSRD